MKSLIKIVTAAAMTAAAFLISNPLPAQTILAGWNATGLTGSGPSPWAPTTSNPNLTIGGLTKGAGVTNTATANVWGGNSWTNAGVAAGYSQAVNGNKFVTLTIQPNPGYTLAITNISKFLYSHSATGPTNSLLEYSIDGTTFFSITNVYITNNTAVSGSNNNINLSGIPALQSINSSTTVTFRIVNWGGTSFAGTWYINPNGTTGNDLEFQGVLTSSGVAPTITSISPGNVTTNAGNTVAFTVTATGDPASNYWYKITGSITNLIPGATTATLTLSDVLGADTGGYFAVLSNATGTATSAVVSLTVIDPFITAQPASVFGLLDGTAQFAVSAAGTSPGYQWYQFDGTSIYSPLNNGPQSSGSVVFGATDSTLTITNLQALDPTNFVVVVTGTYGSVTSSVASLLSVNNNAILTFWDFNGDSFTNNLIHPAPYYGAGTASALNCTTISGVVDPANGAGFTTHLPNYSWGTQNYPLTGLNKQCGVQFNVSTVGAKNITVSYDSRVSGTASDYERLQYTTNGTDWIDYPASSTFSGHATTYYPFSYSLAGFPGVENNPNFGIRVVTEFQSTATYGISPTNNYVGTANTYGTAGTVTYDIVTVSGDAITNDNTPPTISGFADTNTPDYLPLTLDFTVGDKETPADSLTVSAVSLDPSVVNPSFNFGGSGADRTLTIIPNTIPTQVGAAPILVTVTDGNGDFTSAWFLLTVTSVNLAPTNSLAKLTATNTLANLPVTIPFTVGDDRTPVSGLTYSVASANNSLVPSENIVVQGVGTPNPTVTITPASNQLGVASVSVTVNDNDAQEPRSTTATIALMIRPNTNVVAIDYFSYDQSGPLDALSAGYWQHLSGVYGQLQVGSGVATVDTLDNTENLQTPLLGAPYTTNSGAVLYSSFIVSLKDPLRQPQANGSYFALFNDGSGVTGPYECRVMAATNGAAPGNYRIGINNFGANAASGRMFPQDLIQGSNYVVVTALVLSNGFSTLWINPNSQSSPSVTDTTAAPAATNLYNISDFELRESGADAGSVSVSRLKVGTTFDAVLPMLHVQTAGTNAVVNWSDPTLSIQSATDVAGPYTDVSGGAPYTNNAGANSMMFFRFKR
jgi:hypothetical protein